MLRAVGAHLAVVVFAVTLMATADAQGTRYRDANGKLRVALSQQPFTPNGTSRGPATLANGGVQPALAQLGASVRLSEAQLTAQQDTECGGWKRLGMALGNFADIVAQNERDGYFTVGLLATCPSMPGLVAGLQRAGASGPLKIGMLWLDAHPDFGFATIPATDSGGLSLAAVNRMIAGAVRGVMARR